MPLQKTDAYVKFDKAMKDSLAKFNATEQKGMRIRFVEQELKPLGKRLRLNDEEWTNSIGFCADKSLLPSDKDEHFNAWADKWNLGTYDPTDPVKKSKAKPAKRGSALDDIKLDDCPDPEPEITKPDIEADKFCKEMPDRIESLPITTNTDKCPSAKSQCAPLDYAVESKPKPKDKPMPKTKQELLTELLSSSDGLSEQEVKKICVSTFCDLFKEVIDSVQTSAMCMLNQIQKDEDDKQ
jgi:hypothetical protein